MSETYDAIVVGARCAGSPTAMLLASKGYRVLVVDRATFPADTVSTLLIHPPGVAALERWGLLDAVKATGCPPVTEYSLDFGPFALKGSPGLGGVAYAPRRTLLDKILVDAASAAGAEVREGFLVDDLTTEDGRVTGIRGRDHGGEEVEAKARIVIGADGRHSIVAKKVDAPAYNERPEVLCGYYTFFENLPVDTFETYARDKRGFAALPTNDDLTLVIAGWPFAEYDEFRKDVEGNFFSTLELAPDLAARVKSATRVEKIVGAAVANYFRKPFGPGWALAGDAGYNRDPITAQGISNAFLDAERCATAVDAVLSGARSADEAMGEWQAARDTAVAPTYEFTLQLASLEPPPPDMQALLGAIAHSQESMDQFMEVLSGVTSPAVLFAPDNVGRIFAMASGG